MVNLKHAISAIAAVAMVGSLAANQAADKTYVNAQNLSNIQLNPPAIIKGDGNGAVLNDVQSVFDIKTDEEDKSNTSDTGYVCITESYLNMRVEPSVDADVVKQLECASEVKILSDEGEWYHVQNGEDTGYVYKDFITLSYDEAQKALLENFKYESGYINADGVNIRDNAGTENSNIIDQTASGDKVFVIKHADDEWLLVYYGANYDIGYVMSSYVTIDGVTDKDDVAAAKINRINSIAKKGIVSSDGAMLNVRALPNENAEVIASLEDGASVRIITKGSNWTKIAVGDNGKTAYIKSEYVLDEEQIAAREAAKKAAAEKKAADEKKAAAAKQASKQTSSNKTAKSAETTKAAGTGNGQAIVNEAKKYIGTRYVYGGNSPSAGFDCSGLVQYVCRRVGISVSRSSSAQYGNGVAVSRSDLQPGDLIFFSKGSGISHVVIYAGNGQVIHSPRPGKSVCYTTLSNICSYSKYVGARRVW